MLEVDGHEIVGHAPDVFVCDSPQEANARAAECATLLLAGVGEIPAAIDAMRNGVKGYIYLPLQLQEDRIG